jgi:hypothetical protein
MNAPLQNMFKLQLKSFTGFEFQDAVVKVFLYKYGETDFTVMRHQKDKGCDGIIESEKRVIACFGPETTQDTRKRHNDFSKKVNSDFELYKTNWQANYPNWTVVINHEIDPEYDRIVKKLSPRAQIFGLEQLLFMVDNLNSYQKHQLGKLFDIPKEFLSFDYLQDFLENILRKSESEYYNENIKYDKDKLINAIEKIELNYDRADVQDAINEFNFLFEEGCLKLVSDVMSIYEDEAITRMKYKILSDYNNTNGDFKKRLEQLFNLYLQKYSSIGDDDYSLYIRAVLITLFEQCLIGNKVRVA